MLKLRKIKPKSQHYMACNWQGWVFNPDLVTLGHNFFLAHLKGRLYYAIPNVSKYKPPSHLWLIPLVVVYFLCQIQHRMCTCHSKNYTLAIFTNKTSFSWSVDIPDILLTKWSSTHSPSYSLPFCITWPHSILFNSFCKVGMIPEMITMRVKRGNDYRDLS